MTAKRLAAVHEHPAKAAPAPANAEHLHDALSRASFALDGASEVMGQLHGLFGAIRQQSSPDSEPLARIGEGLTSTWLDLLGDSAEGTRSLLDMPRPITPAATPATSTPPNLRPPARAVGTLPMEAYDTATLHLEKAETLLDLLLALDGSGAQQMLSAKALGCTFAALSDELASVRDALRHCHTQGET